MKKLFVYIMLVLTVILGLNVTPVYAADYATNGSGDDWTSFVTKFEDVLKSYYLFESFEITNDGSSMVIDYQGYEPDDVGQIKFSYTSGVLELISYTDGYYSENVVSAVLDVYAEIQDYSAKLYRYVFDNLDNEFTLEKDGIEFSGHLYYTQEEIDQIIESSELEEGWGFVNPFVFERFKLALSNKLKNYDESLIPLYYVYDGTEKFDTTKNSVLKFTCDGDFSLFDKVYIDGAEVDDSNYTVTEGSTIIEFKQDYAKKLSVGTHELKITYTNGEFGSASFEVIQTVANPETSYAFGYKELALIVLLLMGAYIVVRKSKFKFN